MKALVGNFLFHFFLDKKVEQKIKSSEKCSRYRYAHRDLR